MPNKNRTTRKKTSPTPNTGVSPVNPKYVKKTQKVLGKCSKFEEIIIIGGLIGNSPGWLSFIKIEKLPNIWSTAIPAEELLGFRTGVREIIVFIIPILIVILTDVLIKGIKWSNRHWISRIILRIVYGFLCTRSIVYIVIKIQGIN